MRGGPNAADHQHLSSAFLKTLLNTRPNSSLFRAVFQYLPIRDSPNENPHVELALQPGELVLVHGPMDEDCFYWGETLDNRAGLIPSNFVQRVPDEEMSNLLQPVQQPSKITTTTATTTFAPIEESFCSPLPSTSTITTTNAFPLQNNKLYNLKQQSPLINRSESPSFVLSVPQHLAHIRHDFTELEKQQKQLLQPDSVCPYPPTDVNKITVQELKNPENPRVPHPRELQVERRLSRSLLISWLPPENGGVVPGSFKCRALLEDLDLDKFVNVSVRSVTSDGLTSSDAACTLAVGAESPVAPQHVRVNNLTPTSAQLSWYPSNSNAEHIILLNAIKVGVCPPAVFQVDFYFKNVFNVFTKVQINGLTPSTIYRLSVRTKHPRAVLEKRPVERCVDFKTLPKIGLPDPPVDVRAENGPQPGTLLVSWKPNSSQPRPPSRAAVHGYLVHADGRCIAEVPGSTADHVLLRLSDFADDPPMFITVRTKTKEGTVSADSKVVRVPRGNVGTSEREGVGAVQNSSLPYYNSDRLVSSEKNFSSPNKIPTGLLIIPSKQQYQQNTTTPIPLQNNINKWEEKPVVAPFTNVTDPLQQQSSSYQQQQYFTFHPKTLDKTYYNPRNGKSTNEQNNGNTQPNSTLYFLEQNYLQKHQQRQRLHSAAPSTSRSFLQSRASNNNIPPSIPSQIAKKMLKTNLATNFLQQQQPPESTRSEPDLRPMRREEISGNSRWFVAIQDHQPRMGITEELPFRRHQLVKVYGDVDMNGFFWAEARGRYGFVPFNKLVEIAKDDLFLAAEQHVGTSMAEGGQPWTGGISSSQRRMRWGSIKSRSYEHTEHPGRYSNRQVGGVQADYETGRGSQPLYYPDSYVERTVRRGRQLPEYRGATVGVGSPIEQRSLPNTGNVKASSGIVVREKENRESRDRGDRGYYRTPQVNGGTTRVQGREKKKIAESSTNEEEEQMAEITKYQQQNYNNSQYQQRTSMDEEEQQIDDGYSYDEQLQHGGEYHQQHQMRGIQSQLMVAKYDYDSRHLSPNVDAEQVELSFRQGDLITIFGPMDEDGFYLGELNGIRGLVPSNFLHPAPTEPVLHRPKGVAFCSDLNNSDYQMMAKTSIGNKKGNAEQSGGRGQQQQPQTLGTSSSTPKMTGGLPSTSSTAKINKIQISNQQQPSTAPIPAKSLIKKSSDLSNKAIQQQQTNVRKGSHAGTKGPHSVVKKKGT
uniref:SH3 domain-containing protein n=1 Tax=Meloidogyne hapla TaxID=6305 RepID=A0A1I8BQB1_MELHA